MANLRVVLINVIDSTNLTAQFTDKLDTHIGVANVTIIPQLNNIPQPLVLGITINGNIMDIETQPLTPLVPYLVLFASTDNILFKSVNGYSFLNDDDISNQQLIIGPIESNNTIQQFLINYLRDNIYNIFDTNTIVSALVQAYTNIFSKALYDIRQVKNENYLSFTVMDEQKVRSDGPFDRLNEEAAYEILRVGANPTGTINIFTLPIPLFGQSEITLLTTKTSEILLPNNIDAIGYFNINDFFLTVSNQEVTKLTSLTFTYSDSRLPYIYDITKYGYQILNSQYDKDYGSTYLLLNNNQFKLNTAILNDGYFSTNNIAQIQVNYEYKDLGRVIDPSTVQVSSIMSAKREVIPPIINIFTLQHAPITDLYGNIETINGITFIDPNALTPTSQHPAFLYEIPFNFGSPPSMPGQYAINYNTGMVYVYGSDFTNNGTGPLPPLATYNYKYLYKSSLDYAYDSDTNDLVALPNGNLLNNSATIVFNYEQVLVPNIDYRADLHIEVLSERIKNHLLALDTLSVENSPITNVFRIYNETSGEIYNLVRWYNNKIYFNYNIPPNILALNGERVSFSNQLNETLFIASTLVNTNLLNVFQCNLQNNNIISASQDCIASSINSSATFSEIQFFISELWYDGNESVTLNINRLTQIGQYMIDYVNGIIYVAIIDPTNISIGTISYTLNTIIPQFPHLISVDDIYYRISLIDPKNKHFAYTSFADNAILPSTFDLSDEALLGGVSGEVYQVYTSGDGYQIGAFVNAIFEPVVSNDIKFLRGIYEFDNLKNDIAPLNFAPFATFINRTITLNPYTYQEFGSVLYNVSDGYYISTNINISYLTNFIFTISVKRLSDGYQLGSGATVVAGQPVIFKLSGINSPMVGDTVSITYSIAIIDLARVIVDYNKGDYYIDYTYLADEIIVSYEYGDNVLDFRQSLVLAAGQTYYTSYHVGALRDALLKNFGALINIPELNTFDTTFVRERYRDALTAALSSFIQGPTITAMENLVEQITHIKPEIIESAFTTWALGSSTLNPVGLQTTGEFELLPAVYDNGVLINTDGQTITFPVSSNLRLENGTFECWVLPQWNGLDNDATLTFSILKNNIIVPSDHIFIGTSEYHPIYINNNFSLDKISEVSGTPNTNKDGIYIYYDKDTSGNFYRWYCRVVDGYSDGYNDDGYLVDYTIKVSSTGTFYDVKSTIFPTPNDVSITSGSNKLTLSIDGYAALDRTFTFISDIEHYILDFGQQTNKNRFSIFKDSSGYLNFKVYDNRRIAYIVSGDVSSWTNGTPHQVAASWNLNTLNNQDEMHLFIDGLEVSNIIRYGTKIQPYLHEHFRTINPEEIAGVISKNIVGSNDLTTMISSNVVSSSLNFSAYGIMNGDTIFIDEPGFNTNGYTITVVNGNSLTLSSPMPTNLTDGNFSVNKTSINVTTEIDIYPNIAVSTISSILDGYDLSTIMSSNIVSSASVNFSTAGIQAGYLLRLDGYDGYFISHYTILSISGNSLVINDTLPISLSNIIFHIYTNNPVEIPGVRALYPSYSIGEEPIDGYIDYTLTLLNDIKANDLIFINTLGINHRRIRQNYYQWATIDGYSWAPIDGYSPIPDGYGFNDGYSNVILTRLPPPISLNQVSIDHILLTPTAIDGYDGYYIDGYNATISGGILTSFQLSIDQPSISDNGRTLSVTITSTNNIDFTIPVTIMINGYNGISTITETITFSDITQLGIAQNTINQFLTVNYVQVSGKPQSSYLATPTTAVKNKSFLVLKIQEAFSITTPENSMVYPVVRFSYPVLSGTTLSGSGSTITDLNRSFSSLDVNNYVVITSPPAAGGTYQIISVSPDLHSATINAFLSPFSDDGYYQVLNTTTYRSGLQNGFFVLEQANAPGVPYFLRRGLYAFDYYTYLSIKLDPIDSHAYLGSDINGQYLLNGILDEVKIISQKLIDTRIGEVVQDNQETITKDYNSLKALTANSSTLMLSHFDTFPFTNDADFYIISENKAFVQSGISVNDNFGQSISITKKPFIIDNAGILDTTSQGTIEFWVSPRFDAQNDPNYRFYFDATAIQIEKVISIDNISVMVSGSVGQVLSVKLQDGNPNIDYFAGGKVEISTIGAIMETSTSIGTNMVIASQPILQVITIKIANDPTHMDYFAGGVIGTDKKTIFLSKTLPTTPLQLVLTYKPASGGNQTFNTQVIRLNRELPNQQTPVIVTYIPNGAQGDRIAIYKDPYGYINFNVTASGIDYIVRAPIFWVAGSWHRLKATYNVNGGQNNDTIRLFIDGYERGNILFGTGLLYGDPHVFGSSFIGSSTIKTNIIFKDMANELFIGSDFTSSNSAYALVDNLRISNIARPVYSPFGESIDVNYNNNLDVVFPVTTDLYTTLLLDFDTLTTKNTNFAVLANKNNGSFDFTINIYDSFDIVSSSSTVKNVLETLINTLKSATSRAFLKYFE